MNNHIQLVLKSSTTELSLNDRELGIYVVPQLDGLTGLPEIRTTSGVNSGYDGGWTSAQNYDARSITIRGVIANEDVATVERLRRQLVSLAGQGKNEELTLDLVTEAGNSYTLQVRTIALEMAMQRVLKQQEFMLQLRADDPLIYDNSEQTHEALIQVAKATGGFRIDFALPLAIDGGSEETVVSNEGLEEVPTITRMYGALHNPKIINHTTNQSMQITADLGYAQGEPIDPRDAEGSNISIDDAIEAPFNNVQLLGNTEQTTYTGKNLLPIRPSGSAGIAVSYDSATGDITVSGTATGAYPHITEQNAITNIIPSGTTLTFSTIDFITGASIIHLRLYKADTSGTYADIALSNSVRSKQYTLEYDVNKTMVLLQTTTGSVLSGKIKLQVEAGSTATDFEPYVGGTASPNPDYPQTVKTTTGRQVVEVAGKNLYNIGNSVDEFFTTDNNGTKLSYLNPNTYVSATFGQSKMTVNTYNTSGYRWLSKWVNIKPNTTYTISAPESGRFAIVGFDSQDVNTVGTAIAEQTAGTNVEKTFNSGNYKYYAVSIYPSPAGRIFNEVQLELGNSKTDFEPYQGYSHEINLGKNLLDINAGFTNTYISDSGTEQDSTKIVLFNGYISVEPSTTYTFSSSHTNANMTPVFYTSGKVFISRLLKINTNFNTFTTPSNCRYIRLQTNYNNSVDMDNNVVASMNLQLELGSQASEYAPYFNPIELCKLGTYQDYIYKQDGKWYVHKEVGKVILNGSESGWQANTAIVGGYLMTYSSSSPFYGTLALGLPSYQSLSTHFKIQRQGATWTGDGWGGFNASGVFWCENLSKTTVNDFKTWLATARPSIYYVLATPTDTEITYEPLVEQLNNLQWGGTLKGTNNISVDSPELEGILDISYFTDRNPDRRDEIVIDSRLKTITLNGLDIYNLKTEGSEFLTLAPGENKLSLQSDINGDNGYAEISYKQGYLSI